MTKVGAPSTDKPATSEEKIAAQNQDLIDTFTTEAGKRVLDRLISGNCMMQSSYTPGDPHETSFCEGRRAVVLGILSEMGRAMTPQDFIQREH